MVASDTGPTASLLEDVVELVRAAGELTLRWFRDDALSIDRKGDGTPVTEADRAAERFLREQLAARFPDDAIIGEEEPASAGSSGRTWVIDPIDGTKSFTFGVPLYSNLVARYDEHGCAIGVINLPALGQTVYAGRGLGCFEDGRPVRVSATPTLRDGCLCTSGLGPWSPAQLDAVRGTGALLRTWGDGFGFALVATGRIEAMVDPKVAVWDLGPLPVVIREAGGRYSELDGSERVVLDPGRVASAVATNGSVHDEVLAALREQ
jgi:histidinol phosphatase-like enzyme (inositol monophosphatase family)